MRSGAARELQEEFGIGVNLLELGGGDVKAEYGNVIHLLSIGEYDGLLDIHGNEWCESRWQLLELVKASVEEEPDVYAESFMRILEFYQNSGSTPTAVTLKNNARESRSQPRIWSY